MMQLQDVSDTQLEAHVMFSYLAYFSSFKKIKVGLCDLNAVCQWNNPPLPPGKEHPVPTGYEFGWAPEPVWILLRREKLLPHAEDRTTAVQSVACCYTDWAIETFLGDKALVPSGRDVCPPTASLRSYRNTQNRHTQNKKINKPTKT
jgi:hypothetical protein